MLERIALHQTRLRTPGVGLDPKGVAIGAKGVVLLASIDRLVGLLAVYTRERSLDELMPSLAISLVRSPLGTSEILLEFAAESSDRMDRIAETARLVGGFTFTGTSRHYVQYRDAAAPFGYDANELLSTDAPLAIYHDRFSQTYTVERPIELRSLIVRVVLQPDARTLLAPGPRVLVAEQGLGPTLVHYLVRSRVEGEVFVAEWPPESAFDGPLVRRWVVRLAQLPDRMRTLVQGTPGITCFLPAGPGVAVEAGYRHPLALRGCPVFNAAGLVLLRGRAEEPWVVETVPPMGPLSAFARIELRAAAPGAEAAVAHATMQAHEVRVALRVAPSTSPWRNVTATWIEPRQLPLLRRLAYALPRRTIAESSVATTGRGAFVRCPSGIEAIPIGTFFVEVYPNLYVPAGHEVTPAVAPELLARAIGAQPSQVLFVQADGRVVAIEEAGFAPLDVSLLEALPWEPLVANLIQQALAEAPIDLRVTPIGIRPLRHVEPETPPSSTPSKSAVTGAARGDPPSETER
ncbi:MAG: hypothetical protein M3O50_10260 [Myxococcota bacterium]|nr:hypothetical protein [Myxococcota bacterium]